MRFRVGQKVSCVDNKPQFGSVWMYPNEQPVLGGIYTIHGVGTCPNEGIPIVFLAELERSGGLGYGPRRFRPLVDGPGHSFTTGADPDSKRFDNRRKLRQRVDKQTS